MSKCPKCHQAINRVKINPVPAIGPNGDEYEGLIYACPSCSVALGVCIDPVLLTNQILHQLSNLGVAAAA